MDLIWICYQGRASCFAACCLDELHVAELRKRWANYWKDYKEAQEWYKTKGVPQGANAEHHDLFWETQKRGSGEDFYLYDSVAVQVSGTEVDSVRSLQSFEELFSRYAAAC